MAKKGNTPLEVRISTPAEVLWEGDAESVSSENLDGNFDILSLHANFITLIQEKPIIVRTSERDRRYTFKSAVIYTHDNVIRIFGDI